MKSLVTLLITVFASAAFAGGSGGGGVMMNNFMVRPDRAFEPGGGDGLRPGSEIVFHMGQENGLIKFAYAQNIGSKWQTQRIALPTATLKSDPAVMIALEESSKLKQWAKIK